MTRATGAAGVTLAALAALATLALAGAPAPAAAQSASASTDLAKPPVLGPPPSVMLPPIVTRTLPNGLTLVIVEQHELPVADFLLQVRAGGAANPANKPGVASLTAELLDEGTATRTALQIADQEAFLGVRLSTGSGWDGSDVELHATTAHLDSALALFADVALRPAFPTADFARIRRERITQLVQLKDRPPAIADRAFASILYGAKHPYGRPQTGTERSVATITRADLQQFYETYYRPNNATLIIVGDVQPDAVERRVRELFGAWERGEIPAGSESALPARAAGGRTAVYLIDKPKAPQASVRIGVVAAPRATGDYFPLQVMNTILGGAFTSRLNQNLRETHGYTYGAGSRFEMRRLAGPFVASAEVTGTKADSALVEFMKELAGIRAVVPAAELEKAKRYLQLQLPGRFETTDGIASNLSSLALYGLPLDFFDSYVQRVEAVTAADVERTARKYIDPASLAVVVVGDRKSIEPAIRALKLGDISIRTPEGAPVAIP